MSTSLNLLGANLNTTTSVADFSNFTKVKVAVSDEADAAARNDYVNTKISQIGNTGSVLKLKIDTQTMTGSITGSITAENGSYILVASNDFYNNLVYIDPGSGNVDGKVIILQAFSPSFGITVRSTPGIRLIGGANSTFELINYNTLQLIYFQSSWRELSRTVVPS